MAKSEKPKTAAEDIAEQSSRLLRDIAEGAKGYEEKVNRRYAKRIAKREERAAFLAEIDKVQAENAKAAAKTAAKAADTAK